MITVSHGSVNFDKVNWKLVNALTVPCIRMDTLFASLKVQHINFAVIDVEGAELTVLNSIDFNKVVFDVLCIETDSTNRPAGFARSMKENSSPCVCPFTVGPGFAIAHSKHSLSLVSNWASIAPLRLTMPSSLKEARCCSVIWNPIFPPVLIHFTDYTASVFFSKRSFF